MTTTILIVEDESIVAQDMAWSLESFGYEVCAVVDTGELALKKLREHKPDLILMDIRIKGDWDGIETAQRIWAEQSVPIVYLTAYSDQATLQRAKHTQPFAYLLKPFDERELYVTIEIALSKRPAAPMLEVPHHGLYFQCQRTLAGALLEPDGQGQLCGDVSDAQSSLPAHLYYPADAASMALLQSHCADLSVDILDIIGHLWLQNRDQASAGIVLHADDCLRFRNLQAQKSGTGKRGGYELQWRQNILLQLQLLSTFQLKTSQASSPLLTYEALPTAFSWKVKLGSALLAPWQADGRQITLLSQKTLEYDPYRQKWEKRLSRYLGWLWGDKSFKGVSHVKIDGLLHCLAQKPDQKNPIRTKERLELALNVLKQDHALEQWRYRLADEQIIGKKGWLQAWFDWELEIHAPPALLAQYLGFAASAPAPPRSQTHQQQSWAFLKYMRQDRGFSQLQLAEWLGISQSHLSAIERGETPSPATVAKIKQWIVEQL